MKKIVLSLLLFFWASFIFFFSHQPATDSTKVSNGFSKTIIVQVSKLFHIDISEEEIKDIQNKVFVPIRKSAHFLEFLVLGVLTFLLLSTFKIPIQKIFIISFLFCVFYACTDEFHQIFVKGRASSILDVLLDSTGSFCGIVIPYLMYRKKRVKNERSV